MTSGELARKLQRAREATGLSIPQAARRAGGGLSPSTLMDLERGTAASLYGTHRLTRITDRLAEAYRADPTELDPEAPSD